jgi:hypothetical protein
MSISVNLLTSTAGYHLTLSRDLSTGAADF